MVLAKDEEVKRKLLDGIYSLYFLKEVKEVLGLVGDFRFKSLIKALSLQIGNLCQYRELSGIAGVSEPTAKKYLNYLEKTYVGFLVRPFFTNKRVELVKNPKLYFYDLGLRNAVIDNFVEIGGRTDKGALLENFVALGLKGKGEVNFWRTKGKVEVDFVAHEGQELMPIEVKSRLSKMKVPVAMRGFVEKYSPANAIVYNWSWLGRKKLGVTEVKFLAPLTSSYTGQ